MVSRSRSFVRVLLADGHDVLRWGLERVLASGGFRVDPVGGPVAARAGLSRSPALVVVDADLVDAAGRRFFALAKQSGVQGVVVLSALPGEEDLVQGGLPLPVVVLAKPVRGPTLVRTLNALMEMVVEDSEDVAAENLEARG